MPSGIKFYITAIVNIKCIYIWISPKTYGIELTYKYKEFLIFISDTSKRNYLSTSAVYLQRFWTKRTTTGYHCKFGNPLTECF